MKSTLPEKNQDPIKEIIDVTNTKNELNEFHKKFYQEALSADTESYQELLEEYNEALNNYSATLIEFNNGNGDRLRNKNDLSIAIDSMDSDELIDLYLLIFKQTEEELLKLDENYGETITNRAKTDEGKKQILNQLLNFFGLDKEQHDLQIKDPRIEDNIIKVNQVGETEGVNLSQEYRPYIERVQETLNDLDQSIYELGGVRANYFTRINLRSKNMPAPRGGVFGNFTSSPYRSRPYINYPEQYLQQGIVSEKLADNADQQQKDRLLISHTRHEAFHELDADLSWFSNHQDFKGHFNRFEEGFSSNSDFSFFLQDVSEMHAIPDNLGTGGHAWSNEKEYFASVCVLMYALKKEEISITTALENMMFGDFLNNVIGINLERERATFMYQGLLLDDRSSKTGKDKIDYIINQRPFGKGVTRDAIESFLNQSLPSRRIKEFVINLRELGNVIKAVSNDLLKKQHTPERGAAYRFLSVLADNLLSQVESDTYDLFGIEHIVSDQ